MKAIVTALKELAGLVVEDGLVAVGAMVAIAATYLLSRDAALGTSTTVGIALFLLLAASLIASLVRTVRSRASHGEAGVGER